MAHGTGRPLAARLFLEGIEVPFLGATITHTVNQASIAYIDLVPHFSINNIKPRTMVHLEVRNFQDEANGLPYIHAFGGDVFGINFAKTPESRSFSISCIDKSSYWDNVLSYFFNAQQSLSKGAESMTRVGYDQADARKQGINVSATTHSISSYFLQIIRGVLNGPSIDGRAPDFLDAFIQVYRKIGNINDFYRLAEDRLRITDRILLQSSGELAKLLKASEAIDWLEGVIGAESGYQTLRMVIQNLLGLIFHDFVSVPFPAKVPKKGLTKPGLGGADASKRTIGEFVFKPNLYMVPPPACNIFFPDEYSSFQYSRNFFQEPTRLIYQPEVPRAFDAGAGVALPHVYQPDSFDHYMLQKGSFAAAGLTGNDDLLVDQEYGHFNEADSAYSKETNQGKKREQQFLTNEEKMRGILMAKESMVPASTQFRQALSDTGKRTFSAGVARYLFFKKRFEGRGVQITSHLKFSVVPGFTTLILDDSDAGQNVVAYCSSVTHRIYATQGGYTNTTLSYARTAEEQDSSSGKAGEPLIPPWFNSLLFGEVKVPASDPKKRGKQLVVDPKKLSTFFAALLGNKGSQSVNELTNDTTMAGAAEKMVEQYKKAKEAGVVQSFISKTTSREYVSMKEAFEFLGATTSATDLIQVPYLEFSGARIKGNGFSDSKQITERRAVIEEYRKALRESRGFRG